MGCLHFHPYAVRISGMMIPPMEKRTSFEPWRYKNVEKNFLKSNRVSCMMEATVNCNKNTAKLFLRGICRDRRLR